jgi:hypothetical protein
MSAMDDRPFGAVLGDYGLDATGSAMAIDTKFDGPGEETEKFEGANRNTSAAQLGG